MSCGVIVATDKREEWLLPWWWKSYNRCNRYPVTFIDWGMSDLARAWCQERGEVCALPIAPEFFSPLSSLALPIRKAIEVFDFKEAADVRPYWFSKPAAMCASPYDTTLWLDLDCEVLTPLGDLFFYAQRGVKVAIARDPELSQKRNVELGLIAQGAVLYNSGVVAFQKNAPLMKAWAEVSGKEHLQFFGDQNILSHLVHSQDYSVDELPEIYNWRVSQGLHFSARIIHWAGSWGKAFIKKHGGLAGFMSAYSGPQ